MAELTIAELDKAIDMMNKMKAEAVARHERKLDYTKGEVWIACFLGIIIGLAIGIPVGLIW